MKAKRSTLLSLALAFLLALLIVPAVPASASDGSCGKHVTYTLEDGVLTISGSGEMANFDLSNSATSPPWSGQSNSIYTVVIESGVTSVGDDAFRGCYNITSVSLPEGMEAIGENAFYGCSNQNFIDLRLPTTLRSLGKSAFQGCAYLHMITIPNGVTALPESLFYGCNGLFDVTIPANVRTIGANAFRNTPLCDVYFGGTQAQWEDVTVGDSNASLSTARFHYGATMTYVPVIAGKTCGRGLTYTLDDDHKFTVSGSGWMWDYKTGASYTTPPWSSRSTAIYTVVIEPGAKNVGADAFYSCYNITNVSLPEGMEAIDECAFYGCSNQNFIDLRLPTTLCSLGKSAFQGCDYLHMITIPDGVTVLPESLFYGCNGLFDVTIPANVRTIGADAFRNTPLCDVHFGGTQAQWEDVTVGDSNAPLSTARFHYGAAMTYVPVIEGKTCGRGLTYTLDDDHKFTVSGSGWMWDFNNNASYTTVPWNSRSNAIYTVVIESGAKNVGADAFSGCYNITSVSLPEGMEAIDECAFYGCNNQNFIDLRLPTTLLSLGKSAFQGCDYLHMITIPDGVTVLPESLFYRCNGLFDVTIPANVGTIGANAFRNTPLCDVHFGGTEAQWSGVTVGDSNASLSTARFHYGAAMTYVPVIEGKTCGRGLTYTLDDDHKFTVSGLGWMWDFNNNASYTTPPWSSQSNAIYTVVIEPGAKNVGADAFYSCNNITSVSLPEGMEAIDECAFYGCSNQNFIDLRLPTTLRSFGKSAFQGCAYLHMITIPDGVTVLPESLFYGCNGLFDVAIPASVGTIGAGAFRNAPLCDVHFGGTEAQWSGVTVGDSNAPLSTARFHYGATMTYVPVIAGKTCGRGLTYTLDDNHKFTVSGSGWMWDYKTGSSYTTVPWNSQSNAIYTAVIGDGVQNIGSNAFRGCYNMTALWLPITVTEIGDNAFYSCGKLNDVWYAGTEAERYALITVIGTGNDRLEHEDCVWHYSVEPAILPFTIDDFRVLSTDGTPLGSIPQGKCLVSLTITRTHAAYKNAMVMIASYDASGRFLTGLMWVRVDVPVGGTMTVVLPVDNSSGQIATFKAFIVSGFEDLVPLGEAVCFPK